MIRGVSMAEMRYSKKLKKKIHYCGNGFKGQIIKARGLIFCELCGHEFRQ